MQAKGKWILSTLLLSSLGAQIVPHSALADPEANQAASDKKIQNEQESAAFVEEKAEVVSEDQASRTLFSKDYLLSDNSRETVLSAVPLHYQDDQGNYQDIQLALNLESLFSDPQVESSEAQPSALLSSSLRSAKSFGASALTNLEEAKSPSEDSSEELSQDEPSSEVSNPSQPDPDSSEEPTEPNDSEVEAPATEEREVVEEAPVEKETPKETPSAPSSEPGYTSSTVPYTPSLHTLYTQGFSIGTKQHQLTLVPVDAVAATADASQASIGKLGYSNVWTATDVDLSLTPSGISQTIHLNAADAPSSFRFKVEGQLDDKLTSGDLSLSSAWLSSADGQRREVTQTISEENGVRYLNIDINTEDMSYPIELHTGIELQRPSQTATVTAQEKTSSVGEMSLFAFSAPTTPDTRTYVQYDLSSLPKDTGVREAYLTTTADSGRGNPDTLQVKRAVEPWHEGTLAAANEPRTALRADGASYGKLRNEADGTSRIDLDPDLITRWLTEDQPNYGLQIDGGSEPMSFEETPQLHIRHSGDSVSTLSAAGTPMQFQYFYDEQSRLQYILFSSGERINFTYDTNGNLIKREYVSGS
ncbi:DNRLRE domain-containing protein [Saccharibacillus sp. JS10]|uniref:DNRLRE domain-containing protein n=1 Tax=Saccharibacillus sp. JS10 TaxID=2950552 RepID=UPI00210B7E83|nr:DNRLRE domain-containing protein [Saccharibacillus sp. JS10]MCQ4087561.1 DNRLRE domain-containing protein [Saccharibacillus sp. JS10]